MTCVGDIMSALWVFSALGGGGGGTSWMHWWYVISVLGDIIIVACGTPPVH